MFYVTQEAIVRAQRLADAAQRLASKIDAHPVSGFNGSGYRDLLEDAAHVTGMGIVLQEILGTDGEGRTFREESHER